MMKATAKQWVFLGVFTGALVVACAGIGYRAVAPSPRGGTDAEYGATETTPEAGRKPRRSSLGRRVSYALASPVREEGSEKAGVSPKGIAGRGERDTPSTSATAPAASSRPALTLDNPELVTYSLDDYRIIAELDPFKPIVSERKPQPATVEVPSPLRELPPFPASVLTPKPQSEPQEAEATLTPPAPPSPLQPEPAQGLAVTGPPQDLAVTGYVQTGDDWHILLENVATQEVRMVRPGDEEFGYLIKYIDPTADQLVLEKDGQEVRLKLGNHKQESRPQPKSSRDNPQGNRDPQESNGSRDRSNDPGALL